MRRLLSTLTLALGALGMTVGLARAAVDVPIVSEDAQATVYSLADYAQPFDVIYDVRLDPQPDNASWWLVDLYLLGLRKGGGETQVGVARGFPTASSIEFYTSTAYPGKPPHYRSAPGRCTKTCRIELRGDERFVEALANGRRIGRWPRAALAIRRPYLQFNAEAHGKNDLLYAALTPVRAVVGGAALAPPRCALTTAGMDAERRADGTLAFFGKYRADAQPTFFSLATRTEGPDCDSIGE